QEVRLPSLRRRRPRLLLLRPSGLPSGASGGRLEEGPRLLRANPALTRDQEIRHVHDDRPSGEARGPRKERPRVVRGPGGQRLLRPSLRSAPRARAQHRFRERGPRPGRPRGRGAERGRGPTAREDHRGRARPGRPAWCAGGHPRRPGPILQGVNAVIATARRGAGLPLAPRRGWRRRKEPGHADRRASGVAVEDVTRRVIFLDIDGVLAPILRWDRYGDLDPACIQVLNTIMALGDADVVVSSTWRHGKTVAELQAMLEAQGFTGCVLDTTPAGPPGAGRG